MQFLLYIIYHSVCYTFIPIYSWFDIELNKCRIKARENWFAKTFKRFNGKNGTLYACAHCAANKIIHSLCYHLSIIYLYILYISCYSFRTQHMRGQNAGNKFLFSVFVSILYVCMYVACVFVEY